MKRIDYLFIALGSTARNYYLYGDVYSIQLTRVWSVCACAQRSGGANHRLCMVQRRGLWVGL